MKEQIAYSIDGRRKKFLEMIKDEGFIYNPPYIIGCNEVMGRLIPHYSERTLLLLAQDSDKEPRKVKSKRQRLKNLADKF